MAVSADHLKQAPGLVWELTKGGLCLLIGFSCLFGSSLAPAPRLARDLWIALAVLSLAMGCAALNSVQERELDTTMLRTAARPLPRAAVSPESALVLAILLMAVGVGGLFWQAGFTGLGLGLLAIMLYNGLYTPLKQRTSLAILAGAGCGALPPVIGWIGAGGSLLALPVLLVCTTLVLWQIPHYHLVLLVHRDDYQQSSQPNFLQQLSEPALRRLLLVWIWSLAVVLLLFSQLGLVTSLPLRIAVMANSLLLAFGATYLLATATAPARTFQLLNGSLFCHFLLVVLDGYGPGISSLW